jgi:hypothetical protein
MSKHLRSASANEGLQARGTLFGWLFVSLEASAGSALYFMKRIARAWYPGTSRLASIVRVCAGPPRAIRVAQTLTVAGASDFSWTLSTAQACPKGEGDPRRKLKLLAELSLDEAKGELNAWPVIPR